MNSLETLWDNLLSRQPELIISTFARLTDPEKQAILDHLKLMVSEPDWHPEQRISAQEALEIICKQANLS